jgi:hypothetical protein
VQRWISALVVSTLLGPAVHAQRRHDLREPGWDKPAPATAPSTPARRLVVRDSAAAGDGWMGRMPNHLLPHGAGSHFAQPFIAFIFFLPDGEGLPEMLVSRTEEVRTDSLPVPLLRQHRTGDHQGICADGL